LIAAITRISAKPSSPGVCGVLSCSTQSG
jgi:hypothetical protein